MILEAVILNIIPGQEKDFEAAFTQAAPIISSMDGYLSHQLHHCIETQNRYMLLVQWRSLEAHTVGFRGSEGYQEWKKLLHHFYDPFPNVEHYELVQDYNRL
jgi:heme-degrading monooxygenase HmoA